MVEVQEKAVFPWASSLLAYVSMKVQFKDYLEEWPFPLVAERIG